MKDFRPEEVLDLWFPDTGHENAPDTHGAFWGERMHGGMDAVICEDFADLTLAAAEGRLDHWAETPRGRLALVIALDQFPRSLWRNTPACYGQDIKATRLVWQAIEAGEHHGLAPWEAFFYVIANDHCEGPDHLERMARMDGVVDGLIARSPPALAGMSEAIRPQRDKVRANIRAFGRHPHRNPILGRVSTPEEAAYIAAGEFPHETPPEGVTV